MHWQMYLKLEPKGSLLCVDSQWIQIVNTRAIVIDNVDPGRQYLEGVIIPENTSAEPMEQYSICRVVWSTARSMCI